MVSTCGISNQPLIFCVVLAAPPFGQQPNVLLAAVHDLVLRAQQAAIDEIASRVREGSVPHGRELDAIARGVIDADGLYGVGYADERLYGFSSDGKIVAINPANAQTELLQTSDTIEWWGATTNPVRW